MTGLVERVRCKLDHKCLVESLSKYGCKVRVSHLPDARLIVDFDKPGSPLPANTTRCDYLLIAEGGRGCGWVVPLELKRGKLHADQAIKQLQQGASAAEKVISQNEPIRFRPVAVSGSTSKHERNLLKKKSGTVRFHGRAEPVRLMKCGAALVQVLCP